jgi:two-component system response regulator GlrR
VSLAVAAAKPSRILLVDDDKDSLALLSLWLSKAGFEIVTADSGADALARIDTERPDAVITDLMMAGMDGMELLRQVHRQNPLLPVIMVSGQAQIPDAVAATHLGSAAFLTKPIDKDELIGQVQRALRIYGQDPQASLAEIGKRMVFRSAVMADVLDQARMVADSDITVFISGETGTGKEVLARVVHECSPRREHPFIGINCGAIPEQLLESELFGHEKGAFTGASGRREGLFQAANEGTLFLDEIGDMPLSLQVKILRVLQDFEVRPVGSNRPVPINVRIISATHRHLEDAVKRGEFREDLYYRLNVVPLHLPSLADRREDVPVLLDHFLEQVAERRKQPRKRFAPEALEYPTAAPWPGNVRQLINVVEQCAALSKTEIIPLTMAKRALRDEPGGILTLKEATEIFERNYLIKILHMTAGHVANAAKIAGRNRTDFYKILSQYRIEPAEFREKGADPEETGESDPG